MEFRTRKAHRWVVREKDLLKYWAVMITCVSVYLASGTISTMQHSEHSIWYWASGEQSAVTSAVTPSTGSAGSHAGRNQSTHPLFPVKNYPSGGGKGESGGIRVRGDGAARVWTSNASSILLQKARVLRRDAPSYEMHSTNDTTVEADHNNNNSAPAWLNQTDVKCDGSLAEESSGRGLLYVRFQTDSGTYFTVCRQLWWHYVNMAGKHILSK